MEWYKKLALYAALGFVTFKTWEIAFYFREQIDEDDNSFE